MRNAARSEDYDWQRKKVSLRIDSVFKYLHGIYEAAFSHRHDQVNRVEVFLAIKTSCQVGFMICGVEILTTLFLKRCVLLMLDPMSMMAVDPMQFAKNNPVSTPGVLTFGVVEVVAKAFANPSQ